MPVELPPPEAPPLVPASVLLEGAEQKPATHERPSEQSAVETHSFMHTGPLGGGALEQAPSSIAGVTQAAPVPRSAQALSLSQLFVQTPHEHVMPAAHAVLGSQSLSHVVFPSVLEPPESHAPNHAMTAA